MAIHKQEDGTCVISASSIWLPGCYEDERAAKFAFRISDEAKAKLRDDAKLTGNQVITWQDIKDYKARYK
jgi:hypothetical protein